MAEPPLKFNKSDFLLRNGGEIGGENVLSRVKQFLTNAPKMPTSSSTQPASDVSNADEMATITDLSNLDSDDDDESSVGSSSSEEDSTTDDGIDSGEEEKDFKPGKISIRHKKKRKSADPEASSKLVEFEIHMVEEKEAESPNVENESNGANKSLVEEVLKKGNVVEN